MLIGDAYQKGVSQSLTCFDIAYKTEAQIVGGATTSTNMALHPEGGNSNMKNTIYLISIN